MKRNWRPIVFSAALAVLGPESSIRAQAPTPNSLSVPMFAGVTGDGATVSFSWWAVKDATGYELLRAPDPQQKPVIVASLPRTTLGYRDTQPGTGSQYYQLVATLASGSRTASTWFLYFPPIVKSATADAGDVLVAWSGVLSAPGGYEVWRAPTPQQRATRVGAVSSSALSYRDKQAAAGPFYYQIVAVGSGGSRAASPWFAYHAAIATVASVAQLNATAPTVVPLPIHQLQGMQQKDQAKETLLKLLLQALESAGIDVDPSTMNELVQAMTEGGNGAMQIALSLTMSICDFQIQHASTGELPKAYIADPTSSSTGTAANSSAGDPNPLTAYEIDQVVLGIPTGDASTSRLTNDLKTLLDKRKH